MGETSSKKVVPALTKTDARELKTLVRRDTELLLEELKYRRGDFTGKVNAEKKRRLSEVDEEREARQKADRDEADKALKRIQSRVDSLNKAIVETLAEMVAEGWSGRFGRHIDPHAFTVSLNPSVGQFQPPGRDDSDLDERAITIQRELDEVADAIHESYREAKRTLETREADMLRDLTLQSITTEAAREFILEMPTVEDLLPAPAKLEAIEA